MLKTEQDTAAMYERVLAAAVASLGLSSQRLQADFEHGQWWITDIPTGAQWSVCDATGPDSGRFRGTVDGFDFENVTEGEV